MVVPQRDVESALTETAFQQYLDDIRIRHNHDLYRFALHFDPRDVSKCFLGADSPMEAVDKFRQLMAEWFRRRHATRSDDIVKAPWTSIGVSSPRTDLIPHRLFKLLGRICEMHGEPFEKLLSENGLPFKEMGLAQEDCHPRFVACLLRMGDLLDLDDNRFCPVMQHIAGEKRPSISKAHEDKHAGIRHLRIDQERIEVSAECQTIDGYLETFKWFDWLKQELQAQMANWQLIAPSRALGLLPTLGPITVRLSGDLQILKDGQRPQFSIDDEKAIELLQGSNLYSTKFAFVRELLQNAIDASLLSLWLMKLQNMPSEHWKNPFNESIKRVFDDAPIEVELIEKKIDGLENHDKTSWILKITDKGTGISRDDLAYMLRIGGTQRNMQRQRSINTMPEWMKPSGAFGIGFQSVFLICDEATIKTKSIFSHEILEVAMHSPTGPKEGLILLKRLENDISYPYGTTVEIKFELDTFSKSWSISTDQDKNSLALQFIKSMDPVLDESFPYEAAALFDQIRTFAKMCSLPVNAKLTTTKKNFDITADAATPVFQNFLKVDGSDELAIIYKPNPFGFLSESVNTYYRGQPFEQKAIQLPFVSVTANLLSGKAGAWLTANRDKLAPGADKHLTTTILSALEAQVMLDLQRKDNCEYLNADNRPAFSLFLKAMALQHGKRWIELAKELPDYWLDLPCSPSSENFRDHLGKESLVVGEQSDTNEQEMMGCDLTVYRTWPVSILSIILNYWVNNCSGTIQVIEPHDYSSINSTQNPSPSKKPQDIAAKHRLENAKYSLRYQLKREHQPLYSLAALATRLAGTTRESNANSRFLLALEGEWERLALKDDVRIRARPLFPLIPTKQNVLLPFLYRSFDHAGSRVECTPEQVRLLSEWARPQLVIQASVDEIAKWYQDLANYIDCEVMQQSPHWNFWKRARGIS